MKLFLASSADKTLQLLQDCNPNVGKGVLFVSNAADPYQDRWWVDADRNKFKELGYQVRELDLRSESPETLDQQLQTANILHMCGGSVYYLISLIRDRGLEGVLVQNISAGTVTYTGTSAGSIILSKNVRMFSTEPEEQPYVAKVPDHKGLGLLNFTIIPHSMNPNYVPEHKKMVEAMPLDPTPLLFINDDQAIYMDGNMMRLVEIK
jgi:dipeptidase E